MSLNSHIASIVETISLVDSDDNEMNNSASNEKEDGEVESDSDQNVNNLIFDVRFKKPKDDIRKELKELLTQMISKKPLKLTETVINEQIVFQVWENNESNETEIENLLVGDVLPKLFDIDTNPTTQMKSDCVPSYKRTFKDVLDEEKDEPKIENECKRPKMMSACFNCGSQSHSLRDCPKPRKQARIKRAMKERSYKRYHTDVEQRFSKFAPGKLSNAARRALNLQHGELPHFFYRMRVHGYPPAWLEAAKIVDSGISLFNADGSEVPKSDNEDCELYETKYDETKIIEFPGFNVKPSSKFYDDYRHHCVPPFQNNQLKENFIKSLGRKIVKPTYSRKKLKNLPAAHNTSTETKDSSLICLDDMEIEEVDLTEEKQEITKPPPPPDKEPDDNESRKSPSLENLEEEQAKIIEELSAKPNESENNTIVIKDDESLKNGTITVEKSPSTSQSNETVPSTTAEQTKIVNATYSSAHLGTPIYQFSEYEKLPSGENFKVGISDVINFENLPSATGKYKELKSILEGVRKRQKELSQE